MPIALGLVFLVSPSSCGWHMNFCATLEMFSLCLLRRHNNNNGKFYIGPKKYYPNSNYPNSNGTSHFTIASTTLLGLVMTIIRGFLKPLEDCEFPNHRNFGNFAT